MTKALQDIVRRYAEAHNDGAGVTATPVEGFSVVRATSPSGLDHAIARPLVALVVQGTKLVRMNGRLAAYGAGDSLIIAADGPTVSQITEASVGTPYLSLVLDLDPALIADLSLDMKAAAGNLPIPMHPTDAQSTDAELFDAGFRLMRLLERPGSLPVLGDQLVRELHYWLLAGRHGASIRRLGWPDGHVRRVARAVTILRAEFASALSIERLAAAAGMSASSFHHHFRAVTSLSPLQFQKQLRLIEARRLMLAEGVPASNAAFAVGYQSVPQFTREYRRLFGLPPVRETDAARSSVAA